MRLSEKGLGNVFYHQSLDLDIDSYEFKPEDLTGAVVLTVEEASNIWEHLINYESSIEENEGCMSFKHLEVRDSVRLMRKRIEQAEKDK